MVGSVHLFIGLDLCFFALVLFADALLFSLEQVELFEVKLLRTEPI